MHTVPVESYDNGEKEMTAIIILNWNGADDTITCLDSLSCADGGFYVVVVDNGSTDNSVSRLNDYISQSPMDITLLEMKSNLGFARGNNQGVLFASKRNPDSYLLLNNDTEVTPDFLAKLVDFQLANPEYRILTPRINFYYDKNLIWNCGGKLCCGFRRYLFAGCHESKASGKPYYPISFVTGCALFFMPDVLETDGTVFTQRFFFGEEDFDFSIRMKRDKKRMACVTDSVIYHKVGAANANHNIPGKIYLHLLNRYIDIRLQYGKLAVWMWRIVNKPLSFHHLKREYGSSSDAYSKLRQLEKESRIKNGVTEEDFRKLVVEGNYFDGKDS